MSDCFDICHPVGLGPGTNAMFWLATPPFAAVAVTSAVTTGPFWSMFATAEGERELAFGLRLAQLRVGNPAFDPADATLDVWRLAGGRARAAECLKRLKQRALQVRCRCLRHRDVPNDRSHAGAVVDIAGDAMEVTPAAAPAMTTAAAAPLTRVFRVTIVLSIGPTHQRG